MCVYHTGQTNCRLRHRVFICVLGIYNLSDVENKIYDKRAAKIIRYKLFCIARVLGHSILLVFGTLV